MSKVEVIWSWSNYLLLSTFHVHKREHYTLEKINDIIRNIVDWAWKIPDRQSWNQYITFGLPSVVLKVTIFRQYSTYLPQEKYTGRIHSTSISKICQV